MLTSQGTGSGGDAEGIAFQYRKCHGSANDDVIKGDSRDNKLFGWHGDDVLKGARVTINSTVVLVTIPPWLQGDDSSSVDRETIISVVVPEMTS